MFDEVHRSKNIRDALSEAFLYSGNNRLRPLFCQRNGQPRKWPRWLLLSATPYNPVLLDSGLDVLDVDDASSTWEPNVKGEERKIADEVRRTLGTLAWCAGIFYQPDQDSWFEEHIRIVNDRLADVDNAVGAPPVKPPSQLEVWPQSVHTKERTFTPSGRARANVPKVEPIGSIVKQAVGQLVAVRKAFGGLTANAGLLSTAERIAVSAVPKPDGPNTINGFQYNSSLVSCIVDACGNLSDQDRSKFVKVVSLRKSIDCWPNKNILIFIVHRAVGEGARQVLAEIPRAEVRFRPTLTQRDREWFNERSSGGQRVLIVTDAASESYDLHEKSDVLVHYELPWSPLRVLQRVGRLWRIRKIEKGEPPKPRLPGVVHIVHPGSVEEEILSRLYRRWGYLTTLGLDYMSPKQALGRRLPAVPWQR